MNDLRIGLRPLQLFFAKHHPVLFICLITVLLSVGIYSLYGVSRQAEASTDSQGASTIANFDQATINKIKNLHTSTDASEALTFPSSRYNPFIE